MVTQQHQANDVHPISLGDVLTGVIDHLIVRYYREKRPFRACQPRDLLLQIRNLCLYRGLPLELTNEHFDFAASVYFTVL